MSTQIEFVDGNLIVTRVFDGPRDVVFEAWVETSKVQQWWGCADTTNVRSEIDCEVGGRYNHHMTIHGNEMEGQATITEFDPPARLAYRSASPDGSEEGMLVAVDFTDVEGGTRVQLVHHGIPDMQVGPDIELRAVIRAGWTAAFGKLHDFLSTSVGS